MDTITKDNVLTRCQNVNRRMSSAGSDVRYVIQYDSQGAHLLRTNEHGAIQATVTIGTKREVAEFLHAMMVALDDALF
jgi:hypothetical protein